MQNVYDKYGVRKVNVGNVSLNPVLVDAFGRVRTSNPATIFDSKMSYDTGSILWDQVLTAGGTATHRQNESSVRLAVKANGDAVVRQTRQYLPYRPGKSLLIAATFVMNTVTNVRYRIGFFDANNGIFLEKSAAGVMSINRRTYVTASAVDNSVAQTSWNLDKFDGSGPSGFTLDFTKTQILMIDLQWLGVGRVRVGFDVDGEFWPAHEFLNANSLSVVYMTTATLPIRYEITATGVIGSDGTLDQICSMACSEGGFDDALGFPRAASNGGTALSTTTRRPILSIRPKATYGGITNRMFIQLESIVVYAASVGIEWDLVYNTSLTGAAFTSAGTNSAIEYDVKASALTGGDVIDSGYVAASASARSAIQSAIAVKLPISLDNAGANPIPLTVAAVRIGGAGTADVCAALQWREIQ